MWFLAFFKPIKCVKGHTFESVEAVKIKVTGVLKKLLEKDFQRCFNQWKIRMK
jgi:hypothetical protein